MFLTLLFAALATASFAQPQSGDTIKVGFVNVYDTIVNNDTKLLIANDRLYSKNGLIEAIVKQAGQEKAETGKIEKQAATQTFIDNINSAYAKYEKKFARVDTLSVDSNDVKLSIQKLSDWQNSTLADPEIRDATTLGVWERKNKELQRLLKIYEQIVNLY